MISSRSGDCPRTSSYSTVRADSSIVLGRQLSKWLIEQKESDHTFCERFGADLAEKRSGIIVGMPAGGCSTGPRLRIHGRLL
jgi:hypothetical protein